MAAETGPLVIITSGDSAPYQQAVSGVLRQVENEAPDLRVDALILSGEPEEIRRAAESAMSREPLAIVALGSRALQAVEDIGFDGPVVGALILDQTALEGISNATGVVLRHPPAVQFDLLKQFLPDARRIGVLYNREINESNVESARRAAEAAGLVLDAVGIESPTEIPVALESLTRRVDVLWGIPDAMVMSASTARQILLASLRTRVPLTGPASSWTKSGALYAIEWDYVDIGQQAGEIVEALIDGQSIDDLPLVSPRSLRYSVNLKTASLCNLEISPSLIERAAEIFD